MIYSLIPECNILHDNHSKERWVRCLGLQLNVRLKSIVSISFPPFLGVKVKEVNDSRVLLVKKKTTLQKVTK